MQRPGGKNERQVMTLLTLERGTGAWMLTAKKTNSKIRMTRVNRSVRSYSVLKSV